MFALFWAEIVVARSAGMQRGAKAHCAARSASRFVRSVEQLRGKPCGWLARVRNWDDRHKLLSMRMLRATERGVGRAEPYYDAAIFSHDVERISGLFSRLFSRASIFQQPASKGERCVR
jgi:hypothetical protein